MQGLNKVELIGRIESVEKKETKFGNPIITLKLSTSDAQTHRIILHNRANKHAYDLAVVGAYVYVEGELYSNRIRDKKGHEHIISDKS
jgi:single-stranded DNA-binding protein